MSLSVCGKHLMQTLHRLQQSDRFQTMVSAALNIVGSLLLSIWRWQIVWFVCLCCLWIVISIPMLHVLRVNTQIKKVKMIPFTQSSPTLSWSDLYKILLYYLSNRSCEDSSRVNVKHIKSSSKASFEHGLKIRKQPLPTLNSYKVPAMQLLWKEKLFVEHIIQVLDGTVTSAY